MKLRSADLALMCGIAREALIYSGGWNWLRKKPPCKAQIAAIASYCENLQRRRVAIFRAKSAYMN